MAAQPPNLFLLYARPGSAATRGGGCPESVPPIPRPGFFCENCRTICVQSAPSGRNPAHRSEKRSKTLGKMLKRPLPGDRGDPQILSKIIPPGGFRADEISVIVFPDQMLARLSGSLSILMRLHTSLTQDSQRSLLLRPPVPVTRGAAPFFCFFRELRGRGLLMCRTL